MRCVSGVVNDLLRVLCADSAITAYSVNASRKASSFRLNSSAWSSVVTDDGDAVVTRAGIGAGTDCSLETLGEYCAGSLGRFETGDSLPSSSDKPRFERWAAVNAARCSSNAASRAIASCLSACTSFFSSRILRL